MTSKELPTSPIIIIPVQPPLPSFRMSLTPPTSPGASNSVAIIPTPEEEQADLVIHQMEELLRDEGEGTGEVELESILRKCYAIDANWSIIPPPTASTMPSASNSNNEEQVKKVQHLLTQSHALALKSKFWLLCHLRAIQSLIPIAEDAKARKQLYNHLFFHCLCKDEDAGSGQLQLAEQAQDDEDLFSLIQLLILRGVMDIWSENRKLCSRALGQQFIRRLSKERIEKVYRELLQVVDDDGTSEISSEEVIVSGSIPTNTSNISPIGHHHHHPHQWQNVDGALLAMHYIVNQVEPIDGTDQKTSRSYRTAGLYVSASLPEYVQTTVDIVLRTLRHPQLLVREKAAELLLEILKLGEHSKATRVFQTVLHVLGGGSDAESSRDNSHIDGVLRLGCGLIDMLPPDAILDRWPELRQAFRACLTDTASTIRQLTAAFVQLIARRSLHLTLMSLAAICHVMDDVILEDSNWQGQEGCLLSYEDISNDLLLSEIQSLPQSGPSPLQSLLTMDLHHASLPLPSREPNWALSPPPHALSLSKQLRRQYHRFLPILEHICEQIEACTESAQFEIRRMACQASSSLGRLLVWLDNPVNLLVAPLQKLLQSSSGIITASSASTICFACELPRAAVRHARHVAEIYADSTSSNDNESNTKGLVVVCLSNRWGGRSEGGVANSAFNDLCGQSLLAASSNNKEESQRTKLLRMEEVVRRLHALVETTLLPLFIQTTAAVRSIQLLIPALTENLLLLRTFVGKIEVDGRQSLERVSHKDNDVLEAIACLVVLHRLAYGKLVEKDAEYGQMMCYLSEELLAEEGGDSGEQDAFLILCKGMGESFLGSPRASMDGSNEKKALMADKYISVGTLQYLPSFCSTLTAKQALQFLPFLITWLFLRDDYRWLSVRSADVSLRLVSAVAICLRCISLSVISSSSRDDDEPPFVSSSYIFVVRLDEPLTAQQDSFLINEGGNSSRGLQLLRICQVCTRALLALLENTRTQMESSCFRRLLASLSMMNIIVPDSRILAEALPVLCRYVLRWYKKALEQPQQQQQQQETRRLFGEAYDDSEAAVGKEGGEEEEEKEGGDWDDWDEVEENAGGNGGNGTSSAIAAPPMTGASPRRSSRGTGDGIPTSPRSSNGTPSAIEFLIEFLKESEKTFTSKASSSAAVQSAKVGKLDVDGNGSAKARGPTSVGDVDVDAFVLDSTQALVQAWSLRHGTVEGWSWEEMLKKGLTAPDAALIQSLLDR